MDDTSLLTQLFFYLLSIILKFNYQCALRTHVVFGQFVEVDDDTDAGVWAALAAVEERLGPVLARLQLVLLVVGERLRDFANDAETTSTTSLLLFLRRVKKLMFSINTSSWKPPLFCTHKTWESKFF